MKLYRIYTENKNYDEVMEIASKSFKGFTVMKAEGYWRGIPEHGLVIEILADYFAQKNPRFDRERFLKACGL